MANETKQIRRELTYRGRVQGVGFRYTTRKLAHHYDITGYVQNCPDGTVRVVAEGPIDEIDRFTEELASRMNYFIHSVDSHDGTPTGRYSAFEIYY